MGKLDAARKYNMKWTVVLIISAILMISWLTIRFVGHSSSKPITSNNVVELEYLTSLEVSGIDTIKFLTNTRILARAHWGIIDWRLPSSIGMQITADNRDFASDQFRHIAIITDDSVACCKHRLELWGLDGVYLSDIEYITSDIFIDNVVFENDGVYLSYSLLVSDIESYIKLVNVNNIDNARQLQLSGIVWDIVFLERDDLAIITSKGLYIWNYEDDTSQSYPQFLDGRRLKYDMLLELLVIYGINNIYILDLDGKVLMTHGSETSVLIDCTLISPQNHLLVVTNESVSVIEVETGHLLFHVPYQSEIVAAHLSPYDVLAVATHNGNIDFWSTDTHRVEYSINVGRGDLYPELIEMTFSSDGSMFAFTDFDSVQVWIVAD